MIISISGKPGSGKSTVAIKLSEILGFKRYYVGGMRREAAKAKGMTLAEFNKMGEKSDITDKEFDEFVKKLGLTEDNFIIESRTAFLFIPHSLKIFLDVSDEVGAERIWKALEEGGQSDRNEGKGLNSYEDVLDVVRERIQSDIIRYQKYYNVNIFEKNHFDLFLDTTNMNRQDEFDQVHEFIKNRLEA